MTYQQGQWYLTYQNKYFSFLIMHNISHTSVKRSVYLSRISIEKVLYGRTCVCLNMMKGSKVHSPTFVTVMYFSDNSLNQDAFLTDITFWCKTSKLHLFFFYRLIFFFYRHYDCIPLIWLRKWMKNFFSWKVKYFISLANCLKIYDLWERVSKEN